MRTRCLWATILLAIPTHAALALTPARPTSSKTVLPGDRFVFVMLAPSSVEAETGRMNPEAVARVREIRRVYSRSGMYRNDGATEPLWTVDWYAHGVEIVPDGVHLVRRSRTTTYRRDSRQPDLEQEAISFFANGQLLRTYHIGELVTNPNRLPRSDWGIGWSSEGSLDENRMEYTLTTMDGNRFTFDLRTGLIVSEARVPREWHWGWWAAGGAVLLAVAAWLAWVLLGRAAARA